MHLIDLFFLESDTGIDTRFGFLLSISQEFPEIFANTCLFSNFIIFDSLILEIVCQELCLEVFEDALSGAFHIIGLVQVSCLPHTSIGQILRVVVILPHSDFLFSDAETPIGCPNQLCRFFCLQNTFTDVDNCENENTRFTT